MCEFSTKLIAWHDGELAAHEAAAVEQHVRACRKCRDQLDAFKQVSGMVNAYCDAALASETHRGGPPRWAPVVGAAASVGLLLILFVHTRAPRALPAAPDATVATAAASAAAVTAPPAVPQAAHAPSIKRLRSHFAAAARARQTQDAQASTNWPPSEPAIELAIPGEAIFPPGALPPGIGFVADVSIAADGSAQRLRLQPQLTGFEGGPNHP